jgi:23S rRNA-/tRNA-specific pseudouridylate synthase
MKVPPPVLLWQGRGLWVCNKPHGLLTHGAPGQDSALSRLTAEHVRPFHACHRLDAGTGGALMVALDAAAASSASSLWESGSVHKRYLALVTGTVAWDHQRVDQPLPAAPSRRKASSPDKPAATQAEVLCRGNGATLVVCTPHGGRYHQVRAHLASLGHPVLGDREHQGHAAPVLALHAWTLDFPWDGEDVSVTATPWDGWLRAASRVGINPSAWEAPQRPPQGSTPP